MSTADCTMVTIGLHLDEMQRILTTEGAAVSRGRVEVQEMCRRLDAQLRLAREKRDSFFCPKPLSKVRADMDRS
jgi:hypothetical protein